MDKAGIEFEADGSIARCGSEIKADDWIVPNAEATCDYEIVSVRLLPTTFTGGSYMSRLFDYDLGMSMIGTCHGYDPHNHVGCHVVAECIGVRIGEPTFAAEI